VYIVLSYPNLKYDPHINRHRSPKIFQKWNRTPKGSSNFSNVRVYLFVDTHVHSQVILNQKYDYHINRRWSLKIFKIGPNAERLVEILDVIVYLFVDTYVPIVYRVMSSSTNSTTLTFNRHRFPPKIFKNGTKRRKARRISVM
jgi:hypothetical protein